MAGISSGGIGYGKSHQAENRNRYKHGIRKFWKYTDDIVEIFDEIPTSQNDGDDAAAVDDLPAVDLSPIVPDPKVISQLTEELKQTVEFEVGRLR